MILIDATPIKKFIEDGLNCKDPLKAFGHDAIEILAEIEYAPVIDPETLRPKGRWESDFYKITCSSCKHSVFLGTIGPVYHKAEKENFKFCPNCGAKMEV